MIEIGQHIRDNDPRVPDRVLVITGFANSEGGVPTHVYAERAQGSGGRTRLRLTSIHTDDKPRRTGWSVVPDAASKAA